MKSKFHITRKRKIPKLWISSRINKQQPLITSKISTKLPYSISKISQKFPLITVKANIKQSKSIAKISTNKIKISEKINKEPLKLSAKINKKTTQLTAKINKNKNLQKTAARLKQLKSDLQKISANFIIKHKSNISESQSPENYGLSEFRLPGSYIYSSFFIPDQSLNIKDIHNINKINNNQSLLSFLSLNSTLPYKKKYSEGIVVINEKLEEQSEKHYKILTEYQEVITKYEILVKNSFQLKVFAFIYAQKLQKQIIQSSKLKETKFELKRITNEIKQKQKDEEKYKKQIAQIIKKIEIQKFQKIEKLISKQFSQKIHLQIEKYSNFQVKYNLLVLRQKIIAEIQFKINLEINTLFKKIENKKLQQNSLKGILLDLILLNSYNTKLDLQSDSINEDKAKIFSMIQQIIANINKEEGLSMNIKQAKQVQIIDIISDFNAHGIGKAVNKISTTTPQNSQNSNDNSARSPQEIIIDQQLLGLTSQELTLIEKLYQAVKSVTQIKEKIAVFNQYQFKWKQEIQKLNSEQFSQKIQIGIFLAEIEIYNKRIQGIEKQIASFEKIKDQKKIEKLKEELKLISNKILIPKGNILKLQAQVKILQDKIDNLLNQINKVTEKIIEQKKKLIIYEKQQKEFELEQIKIEKEKAIKKQKEQKMKEEQLTLSKKKNQKISQEIAKKKIYCKECQDKIKQQKANKKSDQQKNVNKKKKTLKQIKEIKKKQTKKQSKQKQKKKEIKAQSAKKKIISSKKSKKQIIKKELKKEIQKKYQAIAKPIKTKIITKNKAQEKSSQNKKNKKSSEKQIQQVIKKNYPAIPKPIKAKMVNKSQNSVIKSNKKNQKKIVKKNIMKKQNKIKIKNQQKKIKGDKQQKKIKKKIIKNKKKQSISQEKEIQQNNKIKSQKIESISKIIEKKIYIKQDFNDGVFRIKQQISKILQFELKQEQKNGGTFFIKMKNSIAKFLDALSQKEQLLEQKETDIQNRKAQIEKTKIKMKKLLPNLKKQLEKCYKCIPAIKKKAQEIQNQNIVAELQKQIQEKEQLLKSLQNKNEQKQNELEKREIQAKVSIDSLNRKKETQQILQKAQEEIINSKAKQKQEQIQAKKNSQVVKDKNIKKSEKIKANKSENKNIKKEKKVNDNKKPKKVAKQEILEKKTQEKKVITSSKKQKIIQKAKEADKQKSQQLLKNNEIILTKPVSNEQNQNLKLESSEYALDNTVKQLEQNSNKNIETRESLSNQWMNIEHNLLQLEKEEKQIQEEENKLIEEKEKVGVEIEKCKLIESDLTKNNINSESQQCCLKKSDEFQEKYNSLIREISTYNQLFKELEQEKNEFENQKKQIFGITEKNKELPNYLLPLLSKNNESEIDKITNIQTEYSTKDENSDLSYPYSISYHNYENIYEYHPYSDLILVQKPFDQEKQSNYKQDLLAKVKQQVECEVQRNNLNQELILINNLAEANAKQQRLWENKIQRLKNNSEHEEFIKSIQFIQMETGTIISNLNQMLGQQPENKNQLKNLTNNIMEDINKVYDLAKKQNKIVSASEILSQKEQNLLQMKNNCVDVESMLKGQQFNAKKARRQHKIYNSYKHLNVSERKFSIDVDANDSIDQLKVIVTLKFTDVDPDTFEVFYQGRKLAESSKILTTGLVDGETIILKPGRTSQSSCCTIF